MTKTGSRAALLHVAIQDLHAGKRAQADRLPAIAEAARDPILRELVLAEAERAAVQAQRLAQAGGEMSGPANLWMAGVLDDADRDARSHQPGPVLDIALVGAVRKAKAAEIVSSETALALCRAEGLDTVRVAVTANREEEMESDRALRERLDALAAPTTTQV